MDVVKNFVNVDISTYVPWIIGIVVVIAIAYIITWIDSYLKARRNKIMYKEIKEINKKLDKLLEKEGLK